MRHKSEKLCLDYYKSKIWLSPNSVAAIWMFSFSIQAKNPTKCNGILSAVKFVFSASTILRSACTPLNCSRPLPFPPISKAIF